MARTTIERYRGDTKDLLIKLTQNKEIFDLTGYSAILSVSDEENPAVANYEFQSSASVDDVEGTLTFPFTLADADRVGLFYYDIQLTDAAGKTGTIRKGEMPFKQDIGK